MMRRAGPTCSAPRARRFVRLQEACAQNRDADLLLFRRRGLLGRAIGTAGRSIYSHAGMLAKWEDDWLVLEVTGLYGGRAVMLRRYVERVPGAIDVYRANPGLRWRQFDRLGAVRVMRELLGIEYGYAGLLHAALLHLPVVRWFIKPDFDDTAVAQRPPFCSQAVALATRRGGGVDPVPMLADRLTEPADLARSAFYEYRCTLVP